MVGWGGVGHTGAMERLWGSNVGLGVRPVAAMVLASALLVGCSSDDDATTAASPALEPTSPTTEVEAVATTTEPPTATSTPATTVRPAASDTIATVPDRAVPGIDSEDPFCRAWSEFAGSFQTLTYASVFGDDPLAGARLEVIAAASVVGAAQALDDAFPREIVDERAEFIDDVVGPFARRAASAADELRSVGVGDGDIELLGEVWRTALVAADPDNPVTTVEVPADLDAAVSAAAASFAANVPPIANDPSLVTEAEAPRTQAYIADRCPDQGILGGNDAID